MLPSSEAQRTFRTKKRTYRLQRLEQNTTPICASFWFKGLGEEKKARPSGTQVPVSKHSHPNSASLPHSSNHRTPLSQSAETGIVTAGELGSTANHKSLSRLHVRVNAASSFLGSMSDSCRELFWICLWVDSQPATSSGDPVYDGRIYVSGSSMNYTIGIDLESSCLRL